MDKSEFLAQYKGDEVGYWADTPSRLFWARVYDAPPELAQQMSRDFLLTSPDEPSPSVTAAREILGVPSMMNKVEAYVEAGKKAAVAMNQSDPGRYDHENGWFRRAKSLEVGFNKEIAQRAYDEGYQYHRAVPRVERFC
jgi:hypothetical protein